MCRGAADVFLQIDIRAGKRRAGFLLWPAPDRAGSSSAVMDDAHAASAAARRSLQNDRIADLPSHLERFFGA